ncbi:MAG: beta-eliminating lyase-related protein [Pseudomonadota bacterium]
MNAAPQLIERPWLPAPSKARVRALAQATAASSLRELESAFAEATEQNRRLHEHGAINLNPASNVMNPRAEALLAGSLGTRPSLGYPGSKHEMGLEAIERIEVMTQELAAQVFDCGYVEYRAPSGTLANLCAFMALAKPGDTLLAPPASIGGHASHLAHGTAGRYGLRVVEMPVDAQRYAIDVDALRAVARRECPALISVGGSMNLFEPALIKIRQIADEVGAKLLFDAAHLAGLIAGGAWPNPLANGAHLMTLSTYKSLAGPPASLILTDDAEIARQLEEAVFPGLTANFDVAKTAALGVCLLDWQALGRAYADRMKICALALARELEQRGVNVFAARHGATQSHQLAVVPEGLDGRGAAVLLGRAGLLASAIGLPLTGGANAGVRLGTPEIVRWGMSTEDMPELASYIGDVLMARRAVADVAADVEAMKRRFQTLHFIR